MGTANSHKLSRRQQECLRLAYRGFSTEEIAYQLEIQPGTAAGYIAEACAIIGVNNRRQAARIFHDAELLDRPSKNGGGFLGVDPSPPAPPSDEQPRRTPDHWGPLALQNREADNDYGISARLAWILILATTIAVGFGALASGVRTVNDLVSGGHRSASHQKGDARH